MQRDDVIRIRHMADAASEALGFVRERRREELYDDRQLVWALVKAIEIIGEAAGKVSEKTQGLLSNIPWGNMIGMRNRLVHGYFDINLDILWKTVVDGLPPILETLKQFLDRADP
jgi:uncharacterized protein with HEPN domain